MTEQPALIIEPWLKRAHDFSVQYEWKNGVLNKVAMVHGENDSRGQFQACLWGPKFGAHLDAEVARFLFDDCGEGAPISIYDGIVPELLAPFLETLGHEGPLGIDAMVYRDATGALKLQAVVEINPRYTMGRVTWELSRRISPGHSLRFELVGNAAAERAGCGGCGGSAVAEVLQIYAGQVQREKPLRFDSNGRLAKGAVVLNEAARARRVLAVLQVFDH